MLLPTLLLLAQLQPASTPTLTARGEGVQIYRCTQQDATYGWVFQSPEATLLDPATHIKLGTHGAGPTWTWNDGSSLIGKVLEKSSPDPASVPWLLLAATPAGTAQGALTPIAFVRRTDTHGGNAPATGCDAAHANTAIRVPYTATYTFYRAH